MSVGLRALRGRDLDEVPHHYERVPLRSSVILLGWCVGPILACSGVTGMVAGAGSIWEAAGAAAAALSGIVIFGLIRLRHYEITLGERWLELSNGPIRHRLGGASVKVKEIRRSSSWRRLYALEEVVLALEAHGRETTVPSRRARELEAALAKADIRTHYL
ncbi:MAG: hypothetical protein LJE95_12650 [Acidobacteria bacterium]|nr:hypothetical protein [Acidobacteriota bacterium]